MTADVALRLLIVMGLWALCYPLITIGLGLAPHLAFAAMRATVAGLCLFGAAVLYRQPFPRGDRVWGLVIVVGLGSTSLGFLGMFHAAEFVSPGLATVIANAQPLLAAILAHAVLGEKLKATGKIGLLVGLFGVIGIAWPGTASGEVRGVLGFAYIFLAAVGVAVGNIAMKRLSDEISATMAMGLQLLIGAVPLALLSVLTEDLLSLTWSAKFVIVLVVLSLFGTSLAFWLWFAALKRVTLNQANVFTFLVPLLGLAIGATFFEERLSWIQAASAVVVVAGIALVQRDGIARGM